MAEKEATLNEVLFIGLILNIQASAMIALGKITNPVTQKMERNLDQARITIDMLGMLDEKTKGNRTDEETRTLQKALTELRLNYLDELKKDHAELERQEAEKEAEAAKSEAGEPRGSEPAGEEEKVEPSEQAAGTAGTGAATQERPPVDAGKQSDKKEAPRKKAGKAGARPRSKLRSKPGPGKGSRKA
ncbi:MAG: DUF1844 domain-containing protein [Candidatus Eiseniibacteriota bacterium]|nr:MAG: DUF1844 domain-containing protein [Candidatus Eisenbacteria bacterium]